MECTVSEGSKPSLRIVEIILSITTEKCLKENVCWEGQWRGNYWAQVVWDVKLAEGRHDTGLHKGGKQLSMLQIWGWRILAIETALIYLPMKSQICLLQDNSIWEILDIRGRFQPQKERYICEHLLLLVQLCSVTSMKRLSNVKLLGSLTRTETWWTNLT